MQHPLIVTESHCARKYSISSFHIAVGGDTRKHICGELLNGCSLNHPANMPWSCEQRKKKKKWPDWNYRRSLCTHKVRALHQRRVNSQDAATQMSRISAIHELALCVTWGHLLSPDEWLLRTADTWGDHVRSSQNTERRCVDIHVIYFILLKPDMVNTVGRYRLQRYIRAPQ